MPHRTDRQPPARAKPRPRTTEKAVAYRNARKPGPVDSPVQVRNAGKTAQRDAPEHWDARDEALDASFPASDATAKY